MVEFSILRGPKLFEFSILRINYLGNRYRKFNGAFGSATGFWATLFATASRPLFLTKSPNSVRRGSRPFSIRWHIVNIRARSSLLLAKDIYLSKFLTIT